MNQVRQAVAAPPSAHTTFSVRKFRAATCLVGRCCRAAFPISVRKFRTAVCVLLASLLSVVCARAGMDDDYMDIYSLINQADTLSASGKVSQAHAKYLEAQKKLTGFQKNNPDWNTKVVSYRLMYLADKIVGTSAKTGAAPASTGTAAKANASTAPASPGVKLLTAGNDPKKQLRLHPAAGDKQTIVMTLKTSTDTDAGGQGTRKMEVPAIVMVLNLEVKSVSTEGEITYEIGVGDASVSGDSGGAPQLAESMNTSLAKVRGITGTGRLNSRGIPAGYELKLPNDADPQFRQTLDQMKESVGKSVAVLPEEAVGPGAKWELRGPYKAGGMTLDQTAVFELISLEGDRLTVRVALAQNAVNQKLENPAMQDVKVTVDKMSATGTGEITMDLGKVFPISGNMEEKSEGNMSVDANGQKQSMSMRTDVSITLESK